MQVPLLTEGRRYLPESSPLKRKASIVGILTNHIKCQMSTKHILLDYREKGLRNTWIHKA